MTNGRLEMWSALRSAGFSTQCPSGTRGFFAVPYEISGIFLWIVLSALPVLAEATDGQSAFGAATLGQTAEIAAASASTLIILFVVALLIESALAVIFNWRLFLELFNGRGVKTLVSIALSGLTVSTFRLDTQVFDALLKSYGLAVDTPDRAVSFLLTTLILAGGSAGVYRILVTLGYRQARSETPGAPKAPKGEAWVAVRVIRKDAVGPIEVFLDKTAAPASATTRELAAILTKPGFWYRIRCVFFPDRDRYPSVAGHVVEPGADYSLRIDAYDTANERLNCLLDSKTYRFADGAVIDFQVTL